MPNHLTDASSLSLPGYTLHEEIGEGGFGRVRRATNNITRQTVAIKILNLDPGFDTAKRRRYIERFERETLLGSRLHHPNIVRLLDKGQYRDDAVYAVFEYIEGESLKERLLKSGPLNALDAAEIMSQVLDALTHAHEQGVIHRDLKPANIMLTRVGAKTHAKILDFGIGALLQEVQHSDYKSITLTQEILGTPSYSAPEQLRGEPPTPKTDLYVWGLVFLECLTGTPAVSGSSFASIFQKQLDPAQIPLPPALVGHASAHLLRRVLEKKVSERAGSALDIYKSFCQLNFSNLVGNIIYANPRKVDNESNGHPHQTVVINNNIFRSGLTEKKHLTVMSVVLHLNSPGGPMNDLEVIDALHRDQKIQCIDIAGQYGATHIGTLGNTLLFYFGYPTTSDNDCRLCARAALEIISKINKQNALRKHTQKVEAEARIGIHSGFITTYPDTVPEGDTANIAITLSHAAKPNQILSTESSRKILEGYIEFEPSAVAQLGFNTAETALYSITGERQAEAFGFLRANRRHQSFIGRHNELAQLKNLLTTKNAGAIHVHGEAGIGKSRLVLELRDNARGHIHIVAQCLPEYKNSALHPIITVLKYKYSLDAFANANPINRLEQILIDVYGAVESKPLQVLCAWLNISLPEDITPAPLLPDEWKSTLFNVVKDLLCHKSPTEPDGASLFVFEDMHWADPTSIEFIAQFLADETFLKSSNIFISTSREALPEILKPVIREQLEVPKLDSDKSAEFIAALLDYQTVSTDVVNVVSTRTDGVPLFIEELVNMLKQKNLLQFVNGMVSFVNRKKLEEVPETLRDSLQQKLDALKSAKYLAQIASAIGREFDYDLLLQSSQNDEASVQLGIEELTHAELVYVQRRVGGDRYIFKHALVRDAAYESMPTTRRQEAHKNIARSLTSLYGDSQDGDWALLAMHYAEATEYKNAVKFGSSAANNSLKRSAAAEAINQAIKIQEWINHLEPDAQVDAALANYSLLTSAYMETKGWASQEVLHYSQASLDLLKNTKRYDELVSNLWWKMLNGIVGGRREGLDKLAVEMEGLIPVVSVINKAAIKCAQGFYHFTDGDRTKAIENLNAAIDFYDAETNKAHQQLFGFDVGVFAKATVARAYADQDKQEKALYWSHRAVEEAKNLDHIPSIGISLMYKGLVQQHYQNKSETMQAAQELIDIAEKYHLPIYLGFGQMLYDWSVNDTSRADEILDRLKSAGSKHGLGHFQSFYADLYAEKHQYQKAIEKIDECLLLDQSINEGNFIAYLYYKKAKYIFFTEGSESLVAALKTTERIAQKQNIFYLSRKIEELKLKVKQHTPLTMKLRTSNEK